MKDDLLVLELVNGSEVTKEPCGMFISLYLSLLVHEWSDPCLCKILCLVLWSDKWMLSSFALQAEVF